MTDQSHGEGQPAASDGTWDRYSNQMIAGLALLVLAMGTVGYRLLEHGAGSMRSTSAPSR